MNIYKIVAKDNKDITWLVGSICDFVVDKGVYFVHTNIEISSLRRKFRKELVDVTIHKLSSKDSCPDAVRVWAINDASKKTLDYVTNNKEEIEKKIINYVIESLTEILSDIEDMKGGNAESG